MSARTARLQELLDSRIRQVPDYPKPGVLFRDITPLLADGKAFGALIDAWAQRYDGEIDEVAGLESRGFILAAPLAHALGIGMVTIRKAGRLPGPVMGVDYALEYGTARLELRPETVTPGSRILVLDDVLATGGTAAAAIHLIEQAGGSVAGLAVLLELQALAGREKLTGYEVESMLQY